MLQTFEKWYYIPTWKSHPHYKYLFQNENFQITNLGKNSVAYLKILSFNNKYWTLKRETFKQW